MRFKCLTESHDDRVARLTAWHYWFAWYPVRTEEGVCAWLETVRRKFHSDVLHWRKHRLAETPVESI